MNSSRCLLRGSPGRAGHGHWPVALAALALLFPACSKSPGPVLPADSAELEDEVRALIEKQVAIVLQDPADGAKHGELGLAYEGNKLWSEAAQAFAIAAELDAEDPLWIYHRALALREAGRTVEALELLVISSSVLADEPAAQYRLGAWKLEAGELDEARKAFDRAGILAPDRPEPLVGLAEVHVARENYEAARVLLEKALDMDPDYRQAHYQLGLAYRSLGRMDEAKRELALGQTIDRRGFDKRVLHDRYAVRAAVYSYSFADRMARATSLIQGGNHHEAIGILEALRVSRPEDTSVLNNLASGYIEIGRHADAEKLLHRILELDDTEFAAHLNLGYAYLGMDKLDLALKHANLAASLAPEVGRVHFVRARVLVRMGAFADARAALEMSVRYDSREPRSLITLGQICMRLQDYPAVIENMTRALKFVPESVDAHLGLLEAYTFLGRPDMADKSLREITRIAPDDPRLHNAQRFLERNR